MKLQVSILVAVFWFASSGYGAETPPELAAAKARYQTALAAGNKLAREQYVQDLQKLKSNAKGKKARALISAIDAEIDAIGRKGKQTDTPYGKPVPGKPGFVTSPYEPYKGYFDVTGFSPGTEIKDPYSGKTFLVPDSK